MVKIPLEKVLKAKERLDMSSRGSDEEYYTHLLDVWCEFVKYKGCRLEKEYAEQHGIPVRYISMSHERNE